MAKLANVPSGSKSAGRMQYLVSDGNQQYLGNTYEGGIRFEFEEQTAADGQTVFTLSDITFTAGSLRVYINSVRQFSGAFSETAPSTVTFSDGLSLGDRVLFEAIKSFSPGVSSLLSDEFTATSGQTDFTLVNTNTSNGQRYAYVNGVYQRNYTVAGGVLTFTGGLFEGDDVLVEIL